MAFVDPYFDQMQGRSEEDPPSYEFVEPEPPTVEDFSDEAAVPTPPPPINDGGDHWDPESGLLICGRCGRMWDGAGFFKHLTVRSSPPSLAGNAQCYPCVDG